MSGTVSSAGVYRPASIMSLSSLRRTDMLPEENGIQEKTIGAVPVSSKIGIVDKKHHAAAARSIHGQRSTVTDPGKVVIRYKTTDMRTLTILSYGIIGACSRRKGDRVIPVHSQGPVVISETERMGDIQIRFKDCTADHSSAPVILCGFKIEQENRRPLFCTVIPALR